MVSLTHILFPVLLPFLPLQCSEPSPPPWQLDRTADLPSVHPTPPLPAIAKGRPPRYRIIALPPRFSVSDTSQAINDRVEIVGYVWLSDEKNYFKELRPAVWSRNKLSLCPGWSQTKNAAVQARAINNKGDVLIVSEGWPLEDGVLRSNTTTSFIAPGGGEPIRIREPVSDQTGFGGEGINDAGEVAGPLWYQPGTDRIPLAEDSGDGNHAAFLYPNGAYVKLFGNGIYAINDRGELVGSSDGGQAMYWARGTIKVLGEGRAIALNNRGDAVYVHRSDSWTLTSYVVKIETGEKFLLSAFSLPNIRAAGVNDRREIVGWAGKKAVWVSTHGVPWGDSRFQRHDVQGIVWRDGKAYRLRDIVTGAEDWHLTHPHDINNRGEIVGMGTYNNKERAFLLVPITN